MSTTTEHTDTIAAIDHSLRQLTWQGQKQALQTLNHPDIALTMPQMITLFAINAVGTCRMSELAETTRQSAGTLTGIVDRLIDDGLVERVRDADDRRVVQVALTPAGKERLTLVERARRADISRWLQYFSHEQLCCFAELLHLLLNGMDERLEKHADTMPPLTPL